MRWQLLLLILIAGCASYSPEVQEQIDACGERDFGRCIIDVAVENNNSAICEEIEYGPHARVCRIAVNENWDSCLKIPQWDINADLPDAESVEGKMKEKFARAARPNHGELTATCLSMLAVELNNHSACAYIFETELPREYFTHCRAYYVRYGENRAICNNTQLVEERDPLREACGEVDEYEAT